MDIRYKGLQYDLPEAVTDRAQKKLFGLRKYLGNEDAPVQVYVELGKETDAHQSGRIWIARINLTNNGTLFRAEATEENIETAIDHAVGELGTELQKAKQKNESMMRKGGTFFKDFMRGGPA